MVSNSRVLDLAADLIVERGWAKGGNEGEPYFNPDPWCYADNGGPVCIEGALRAAYMQLTGEKIRTGTALQAIEPYLLMERYLGQPARRRLYAWNDATERHPNEVVAALRSAAVIERRREVETLVSPQMPERVNA